MILDEAYAALRNIPSFKRVSQSILRNFTLDVTLIAVGVRTGYLVDRVPISPHVEPIRLFSEALAMLRQKITEFNKVVILELPEDGDIFFVNAGLLLGRCRRDGPTDVSEEADTQFVLLSDKDSDSAVLTPIIPSNVQRLLEAILVSLEQDTPSSYPTTLPIQAQSIDTSDMVPLCAILLEYALAYVPTSNGGPYLSNINLDVFSANVVFDDEKWNGGIAKHTFAQFSSPCSLADETSGIVARLWTKFEERISRSGLPCRFESAHRTERLDRVAL